MSVEMDKAMKQLFDQDPADEVFGSEERGISFIKHRTEAAGFPKGWYREETIKSGAGVINPSHKIVHYFSPDGQKYRSKAELARIFGTRLDLSNFDFKSGKMLSSFGNPAVKKYPVSPKAVGAAAKNGLGGSSHVNGGNVNLQRFLEPPVRQCTCIYNQKVKIVETCGRNVCKDGRDTNNSAKSLKSVKPKPVQVYWTKRLENCHTEDSGPKSILMQSLPNGFKAASSVVSESTALTSLAAAVYNASNQGYMGPDNTTFLGQTVPAEKLKLNPGAYINPYQPLITATKVTASLIEEQEQQVQLLRKDLAALLAKQQKQRSQ